jgi:hypothetical protein
LGDNSQKQQPAINDYGKPLIHMPFLLEISAVILPANSNDFGSPGTPFESRHYREFATQRLEHHPIPALSMTTPFLNRRRSTNTRPFLDSTFLHSQTKPLRASPPNYLTNSCANSMHMFVKYF